MKMLLVVALGFFSIKAIAINGYECAPLLSSLPQFLNQENSPKKATQIYLALIKHLVKDKNALSSASLIEMAHENTPPNPMTYVSKELKAEDRFAFSKAFDALSSVDWDFIRNEIRALAAEMERTEEKRRGAKEDTKYVFGLFRVKDITSSQEFESINYFFPKGDDPLFTAWIDQKTYLVNLKTQEIRLISNDILSNVSFLKTRDGRILLTYEGPTNKVIVENAITGENIATLEMPKLFPDIPKYLLSGAPHIYEKPDGSIRIIVEGSSFSGRFVYELDSNEAFVLNTPTGPYFPKIESLSGRTFTRNQTLEHQHIKVIELQAGGSKTLIDEDTPKALGSYVDHAAQNLPSGKTIFWVHSHQGFAIYDIDKPVPQIVTVAPWSLDRWPDRIIEMPGGQMKILAQMKKQEDKDFELALIDMNSNIEKIPIPDSSQLIFKKNAIRLSQFPHFHAINLRDGRTLLVGLVTESNTNLTEFTAKTLYIVDLATKEVRTIKVSQFDIGNLVRVHELADGRIIGFFTRKGKAKIIQIYGPTPDGATHG